MENCEVIYDKHPKRSAFFPSPVELVKSFSNQQEVLSTYELAPSGPIHAGILRMLLYIRSVASEFEKRAIEHKLTIRINDLAGLKQSARRPTGFGKPIAALHPGWHKSSALALECLESELSEIVERIDLRAVRFVRVSEIYENDEFKTLLSSIKPNLPTLIETLASAKFGHIKLFAPTCAKCGLIDIDVVQESSDHTQGLSACGECGSKMPYDIFQSEGLVTFKLESALIWKHLKSDIDYHGQDHAEAFMVSSKVFWQLFGQSPPCPGRINLSFLKGAVVSKSRRNSPAICELDEKELDLLCKFISSRSFSNSLHLDHFIWSRK